MMHDSPNVPLGIGRFHGANKARQVFVLGRRRSLIGMTNKPYSHDE